MSRLDEKWSYIKKPLAAVLGVEVGAICAISVTQAGLVTVDPSSVVFITVLLVDLSVSESFYVTAVFRVIGTLLGVSAGAAVSFLSNFIIDETVSSYGLHSFQLSCLAVLIFVPLMIQKAYPRYSYTCIIFIYTVTSLIFSGTTNAITFATIVAVVGGIIIATVIMRMFNYESAEKTLLRDHRQLLSHVLSMVRYAIHANNTFKEDYFKILEDSKSAFSQNVENITNYERWMRWTRRKSPFDFISLTKALRPLYHQSASLFWSLCRDRVLALGLPTYDAMHLYCDTSEIYFDNFHELVVEMSNAADTLEGKLSSILHQSPSSLLGKIKETLHKGNRESVSHPPLASVVISSLLKEDIEVMIRAIVRMKGRYFTLKASAHRTFSQQWLMSDYIYQLSLVIIELLDYLAVVVENLVSEERKRSRLAKHIRALTIRVESVSRDGFLHARSFDDAGNAADENPAWHKIPSELDDGDDLSVISEKNEGPARQFSLP